MLITFRSRASAAAAILFAAAMVPAPLLAEPASAPVTVAKAWARATPGGAKVGAAYVEITAPAGTADALVSASSPRAGRVELHTHIHEDGVMKMRKVDKLAVSDSKPLSLSPGGDHLMLFDLPQPLAEGETVPLTLVFEKAGSVTVEAPVLGVGAKAPGAAPAGGADASEHKHH